MNRGSETGVVSCMQKSFLPGIIGKLRMKNLEIKKSFMLNLKKGTTVDVATLINDDKKFIGISNKEY